MQPAESTKRGFKPRIRDANLPSAHERMARLLLGQVAELGSEQAFQRLAYQTMADGMKRSWARVTAVSDNAAMPLRLGELFGPMSNTVNCWAWITGHPRTALSIVVDYWNVVSSITQCQVLEAEDLVGIRYSAMHGMALVPDDVQFRFSSWLTMLRSLATPLLRPARVAFSFRKPAYEAEFHRIFDCPIAWNTPPNEMWFSAQDLVPGHPWPARLQTPSPDFWERGAVESSTESRSLVDQLESIAEMSLATGEFGIKFMASRLNMSERTVIRRLREEGTTYREVVDRVRRTKAVQALRDRRMSLRQVASQLGYSNPQNFARAFQRWFGVSPQQGRRRLSAHTRPVNLH